MKNNLQLNLDSNICTILTQSIVAIINKQRNLFSTVDSNFWWRTAFQSVSLQSHSLIFSETLFTSCSLVLMSYKVSSKNRVIFISTKIWFEYVLYKLDIKHLINM